MKMEELKKVSPMIGVPGKLAEPPESHSGTSTAMFPVVLGVDVYFAKSIKAQVTLPVWTVKNEFFDQSACRR